MKQRNFLKSLGYKMVCKTYTQVKNMHTDVML